MTRAGARPARRLAALTVALLALSAPSAPAQDAETLWQQGDRNAAVTLLEQALQRDPGDRAARARLAERLMQVHRYSSAAEVAEPLGASHAGLRGRALYLVGRHEEALALLRQDDPLEALMRVDAHEVLGHDVSVVREALAVAAAQLAEDDARLLVIEGRLALREGLPEQAVAVFERVLAQDPSDPAALFGLGQALVRAGRRAEGLAVMTRHRELVPLIDARDAARQSIDIGPLHADNHAALGDAERALGRHDAALAAYARANALARPEQLVPVALRQARLLSDDLGRPDDAVAVLDEALQRRADLRLLVRAGDILLAAERPAAALERFEVALAQRPEDASLRQRRDQARLAARGTPTDESP